MEMSDAGANLLQKEHELFAGVFGGLVESAEETRLLEWMHKNVISLVSEGEPSTVEISSKYKEADSCSKGNVDSILGAPYVEAKLFRTAEFAFKIVCDSDPALNSEYADCDALSDRLVNDFARRYIRPQLGEEPTAECEQADGGFKPPVPDPVPGPENSPLQDDNPLPSSDSPLPPQPPNPPSPKPIDVDMTPSWFQEGSRCKMAVGAGAHAKWFGGLIGGVDSAGRRIIGFDDGDLQLFSDDDVYTNVNEKLLVSLEADEPGMVESGRGTTRTVGVIVGLTDGELLANEQVYAEHHVCSSAFGPPPARSTRRGQNQARQLSQQERLGFHTFRRGDVIVKYLGTEAGEAEYTAVVYGV
eukprot:4554133-Pleurochrysis_carterae.AAC.1